MTFWTEARDIEYQSVPETFEYWRCEECGALSISPVPKDRLGEIYPSDYYSFQGNGSSPLQTIKSYFDHRLFRKLAASIPRDKVRVLDVGGGSGVLLDSFRRAAPKTNETLIIDIDSSAKSRAEAKGHEFFLGAVEEFKADRKFDIVLMLNIIEHVADPTAVMQQIRQLLSDDGVVLIKTPNPDSLDERLFRRNSWGGYHCPRHWVLFTLPSFKALATRTGFQVETASYTQGAPFWSVSLLGWLQSKGLCRGAEKPLYRHPLNASLMAVFAAFDFARSPFFKTSQMFFVLKPLIPSQRDGPQ